MYGFNTLTTVYGYDAAGNRTTVTDPLGHVTSYGYDARGGNWCQFYFRKKKDAGVSIEELTPIPFDTNSFC